MSTNLIFNKEAVATDEASKNAMGGTEMMKYGLYDKLQPELRDNFQFICSRVRDDKIDSNKKVILWCHDTWDDPENQHLKDKKSRDRFAKIVCVSNYQMSTFNMGLGIPYNECRVLSNAIDPIDVDLEQKDTDETIRLIYHTTPHRGLELLVPVFEALADKHPNIHLDVFSSFEIYGWKQRDQPYLQLFEKCRNHSQITYHGYQPNNVVREALKRAHIFAFPSIWPETGCIAAMEAMSAGVNIVTSNLAALPETTAGFANMYQYHENPQRHAEIFYTALENIISNWHKDLSMTKKRLEFQKIYADNIYNWNNRIEQWEMLLTGILQK